MNYFVTAAALKIASANTLTRSAYHVVTRLRSGARPVFLDRAVWLLDELPRQDARLLDLGTGWVHAYSVYPALLRDDDIHCFDVSDNRHFTSFVRTIPVILEQVRQMALEPALLDRAVRRAEALVKARDFAEAYRTVRINYQTAPSGIPNYPDNYFDRIYSIDVLEHVDAKTFPPAAAAWYRIMKPGGRFLAQVGIDDHLAFYQGQVGSKRYLQYSHHTWDWLLGNDVQYINRLTASEIVRLLKQAGFAIDEVQTHSNDMSRTGVHSDYRAQSEDDIRAVRLFVKAHKPL